MGPREVLEAEPSILQVLRGRVVDREAPVRAASVTALSNMACVGGVNVLGKVLEDTPSVARDPDGEGSSRASSTAAALHGLGGCPDEAVAPWIPRIVDYLRDCSKVVRHVTEETLKCMGPKCAEVVSAQLQTSESTVAKEMAALALGCFQLAFAEPYVDSLISCLESGAPEVQAAAVQSFGKLGPGAGEAAATAVARYLFRAAQGAPGEPQRHSAAQALTCMREASTPALAFLLEEGNAEVRCTALEVAEKIGPLARHASYQVAKLSEDEDVNVRRRSVEALGKLGDLAVASEYLPKRLKEKNPEVLRLSVEAIGNLGPLMIELAPQVIALLQAHAGDEFEGTQNILTRRTICRTLVRLGPGFSTDEIKALANQLKVDPDEETRELCALAMAEQGPSCAPFVQALGAGMKDGSARVRIASCFALSKVGVDGVQLVPALCNLSLTERDADVRRAASEALGAFDSHGVFGISSRLEDHSPQSRLRALEALYHMAYSKSAQELCPSVMRSLKDSELEVRSQACLTLAELAATQLEQQEDQADTLGDSGDGVNEEEALTRALEDEYTLTPLAQAEAVTKELIRCMEEDWRVEVRIKALKGLLRMGPELAGAHAEEIVSNMNHQSIEFRNTVIEVLGNLGETSTPFVPALVAFLGNDGQDQQDLSLNRVAADALGNLGESAAPLAAQALGQRLLSKELGASHSSSGDRTNRMIASRAVASLLTLAEPTGSEMRPGPRNSTRDWEEWQIPELPPSSRAFGETAGGDVDAGDQAGVLDQEAVKAELRRKKQQADAEGMALLHSCAAALGKMGQTGARVLADCLMIPDPERQSMVLHALTSIPNSISPEVAKILCVKLEDGLFSLRQAAVDYLLHRIGEDEQASVFVPLVTDDDPFIRHQAVQALGLLETLGAPLAPDVALRLRDGCWSVRSRAVESLQLMGAEGAKVLVQRLEDDEPEMRLCAVEALGHLGEVASFCSVALVRRLEDSWEAVPPQTVESLLKIGSACLPALSNFIMTGTTTQDVQKKAILAMGCFGEAATDYAPILAGFVGCGVEELEGAAVESLKRLGVAGAAALAAVLAEPEPPVHLSSEEYGLAVIQEAQRNRRRSAADGLASLGEANSEAQTPLLAACMSDQDLTLRKKCADALVVLGRAGAHALSSLLAPDVETHTEVKVLAIESLSRMGDHHKGRYASVLAHCLEDEAPEVRRIAAQALGDLEPKNLTSDLVKKFAEKLSDGDALVRRKSAEALGKMGDKAKPHAEDLSHMLRGPDSWTWAAAAEALGKSGEAKPVHAQILAPRLVDSQGSVRWSAAVALGCLGPAAQEQLWALVGMLSAKEDSMKTTACKALAQMGKVASPAAAALADLLTAQPPVREQACIALGKIGAVQQAGYVAEMLQDEIPFVRTAAANALQDLSDAGAAYAGHVALLLNDSNVSVRMAAARCLVASGDQGAHALIARLMETPDGRAEEVAREPMERVVLEALQDLPPGSIEPYAELLAAFLASTQPELRQSAWSCLCKVSTAGLTGLSRRLSDPNPVIRQGVSEALGRLLSQKPSEHPTQGQVKVMEALAHQLLDTNDMCRQKACEAIGKIGGKLADPHVADLAARLEDHDVRIYQQVLDALALLGPMAASCASYIAARLEAAESRVRASAATALGKIGSSAGLPYAPNLALHVREEQDVEEVRRRSAEALGLLAEGSPQAAASIAASHTEDLTTALLMDKSAAVRRACAEALGRFGPWASSSIHEMSLALGDADLEVRRAVACSLACLGKEAAHEVTAVVRALEDTVELSM
eukprot:TRINITY_DN6500_c0_g1_i1.p1 TRINITY_DN6500_c0_g1~~TRINITY_DN6500_c0_g1_i1.p1  ORF type:complete len:1940 (-),score=420.57 TRINITY_DN6500_c0_g1_i1:60-5420(-)